MIVLLSIIARPKEKTLERGGGTSPNTESQYAQAFTLSLTPIIILNILFDIRVYREIESGAEYAKVIES